MVILMVIVEDLSKCVCLIHDSSGFILRGTYTYIALFCAIHQIFHKVFEFYSGSKFPSWYQCIYTAVSSAVINLLYHLYVNIVCERVRF